jgi:DNA-binding transcriptional MerR regulator
MIEIPPHLLRQWEARFRQLKPGRDRANHRFYTAKDVEIVRRIKYLIFREGMTTDGVRRRLAQELRGEGRPKTNREVLEMVDKLETKVRHLLNLLDE